MDRFRTLRILLMIGCIFAAGIGIGYKLIAPPAPSVTLKIASYEGKEISANVIVDFYHENLTLTEDQKQALRKVADEFVQKIAETKPRSRERLNLFRAYFPKVRALLREDQLERFDALTSKQKERFRQLAAP